MKLKRPLELILFVEASLRTDIPINPDRVKLPRSYVSIFLIYFAQWLLYSIAHVQNSARAPVEQEIGARRSWGLSLSNE